MLGYVNQQLVHSAEEAHLNILIQRLGLIVVAFVVSLLLAVGVFNLLDRLTPKIPFSRLRESSLGTGVYVLGYFVFLGLITHAAFAAAL